MTRRAWVHVSRRGLFRAGVGLGGLGLTQLAARAEASAPSPVRACIMVFYYGGPSHLETYDPKPDAPAEVRGEFRPIATSAPGVHISEHLPRMAQMMDKLVPIRSLVGSEGRHASFQCMTGWPVAQQPPTIGAPMSIHWWASSASWVGVAAWAEVRSGPRWTRPPTGAIGLYPTLG